MKASRRKRLLHDAVQVQPEPETEKIQGTIRPCGETGAGTKPLVFPDPFYKMFGIGAGAGAGSVFQHAATNSMELAMTMRKGTGQPLAKRKRTETIDGDEEDRVIVAAVDAATCPDAMEKDDFEKLKVLVTKFRGDPLLSVLPMPTAAYDALRVPRPGVANAMDAAINCLMKTSTERYTSAEVEVRDLSKTLTADAFPKFYEGPSHPHMLPEGGIRVIEHGAEEAASSRGAGEGASICDTHEPVGGGAGAGSRMMALDE